MASAICEEKNLKRRIKVLRYFILLAEQLQKVHNFNGMFEVLTGLQVPLSLSPHCASHPEWLSCSAYAVSPTPPSDQRRLPPEEDVERVPDSHLQPCIPLPVAYLAGDRQHKRLSKRV